MSLFWAKRPTFNAVQVNTLSELAGWVASLGVVDLVASPTSLSELSVEETGTGWRLNFRWSSTDGPGGSTHMAYVDGSYGDYVVCQLATIWSVTPSVFAEQFEPVQP